MFVKPGQRRDDPALPLLVRMPNGRLLRPAGEKVPDIQFWYRRLEQGDVVIAEPPQPVSKKAAAAPGPPPAPPAPAVDVRLVSAPGWNPPSKESAQVPPAAVGAAAAEPAAPGGAAPALVAGEPMRLTVAEWARVPALGPPDGPAVLGFSTAEAIHDRDPAAPLLTHDEYLAETRK